MKGKVSLVTETEQKEVTIGEMIPEGSTILIAEQADLELAFADGTSFTSQSLNETSAAEADALNEIEQLQALIASGEDPTAELPETAAGNTAASEGDSGFISVSRTGAQTLAGAGYATSGFSVEQPTVQAFTVSSDDAPTITANDTNTIAEDGVATGNVLDNDVDFDTELSVVTFTVDGQTVTAGTAVEVEGGSLVINADGSYTFTPNDNWNGSVPVITYTTNTGESATLTINVTPVDDPSVLANDSNTVAEDTVASGNVLDNDSDIDSELSVVSFSVDGQTVTAGTTVEVEGGSLVINADGSYTFTPNDNWNGSVPVITYTTNTGESATLTINVTPVDDPSVLANDSNTVAEDTVASGNVLDNDSDIDSELSVVSFSVDGQTVTAGTTVEVEGGSLVINADGSYTFTPNDNWNGSVPVITYTTNTGESATLTINVTPVDDPSILANDSNTVAEDTVATGNVLDNDSDIDSELSVVSFSVDGQTVTAGTAVEVEGGSLVINADGSYTFTPNDNWNGSVPVITYTTNTGESATLTINVTPVDDPSILANDSNTVAEDTVASGNVLDNDNDSDIDSELSVVSFSVDGQTVTAGTTVEVEGGSLVINADGSYTFTPNDNWNGSVPVITYTTNTGESATLSITVTPDGDAPILSGDDLGSVTEDASNPTLTDTGTLTIDDADAGESVFQAGNGVPSQGALGSLTIDTNGNWTYNVANADVQYLGEGETKVETFVVLSADGTEHTITITITGTNDVPVIAGDDSGAVTEDASNPTLTDTGTLTIDDADAGESVFQAGNGVPSQGALGSLTIDTNGNWTYNVANADVQYLGEGETKVETFVVLSADGTEHTITITITGTNDVPVIAGDDSGAVTEDASNPTLTDTGTLTIDDADAGESVFQAGNGVPSQGALGSLTIDTNGNWTYNVANADVQYLGEGETKVETFVVLSADGTEHTITITITGTNDVPVIAGDDSGAVTEDASNPTLTDTGTLTIDDADAGESVFQAGNGVPSQGALGSLTIDTNGNWTYNVANADVQYLGEGETKVETFVVLSADGTEHTITITITGTNDVPVIAGDDSGAVTEDASNPTLTDTGTLTIDDADAGESVFQAGNGVPSQGALGSLTIDTNGNWTYNVANADVQYLGEGETKVETFVVLSADGTEHTITITITGTNDVPVIAGDDSGAVTEDASNPTLTDTGTLTIDDADAGESVFQAGNGVPSQGALGSLTIDTNGNWTYNVANADVQYLGEGETKVETFVVLSADGTEHTITITITGTNDVPVIAGDDSGAVTEDASNPTLTDTGTLTIDDADAGESVFQAGNGVPSQGALGSLTIDTNGNWTYNVANADVQYLGEGETKVETFVVLSADGTEHTITITITGTNDVPVIAGDDSGAVTEDASNPTLTDTGTLTIDDADAGESVFQAGNGVPSQGALGSLTIDTNGNWTYNVANADVQYLGEGETKVETFVVLSADGTEHTITITITGTNDVPVIAGDDSGAVTEDASNPTLTDTGTLTIDDADAGESVFQAGNGVPSQGALGSLTIDTNGNWTYNVANADVQYLGEGETKVETFVVLSADGTEHTITITITGTNDVPVIAGDDSGAVTEDASNPTLTDTGTLTIDDADAGESVFQAGNGVPSQGALGSLTIDTNGNWTYNVANADVQYLGEGETKVETFVVLSADGTEHTITITITGTNDVPVIAGDDSGAVTEDASNPTLTDTGTLTIDDADAGESVFQAGNGVPSQGALGSLTIDTNGNWTYNVANADVQYLGEGETKVETFVVLSADGTEHTITITITGTNDVPVIAGDDSGAVTEDASNPTLTDTGTLTIDDADAGESVFQAGNGVPSQGALGSLTIDTNGNWTYNVANADVQYLGEGETKVETFVVLSADGTEHTITITITGTNDVPVIAGDDSGAVTEDASNPTLTDTGTLTIDDADAGESVFQAGNGVPSQGALGSLTIDTNGNWTYNVANADVQYLGEGETKVETFVVLSADGTEHTITITITGTNDVPVIAGDDSGAVTEDASNPTLTDTGTLTIDDADAGESVFQAGNGVPSQGALGSLTIDTNGNWTYNVANADVQYLGEGETKVETFVVLSADGTEHTITITITGTNDVPVIAGDDSGAVTEDASNPTLTDTGTLTIDDADAGESVFQAGNGVPSQGALGSLTIDTNGNWTYNVANADVQYLGEGETKVETFVVLSADGTEHTITITITGTNDVPVIAGDDSGAVTEDASNPTLTDTGTLTIDDADAGESVFQAGNGVPSQGALGSLTIDTNGNWTYNVANADVQYLGEGETKVETFVVLSADGTEHTITITITGTNDVPVIAGDDSGAVTEDASNPTLTDTGTLTIDDADAGESVFQAGNGVPSQGALGSLTIDTNGNWTYNVANADVQYLGEGETKVETFVVLSADGTEHTITITITGTNDVPVIAGDDSGAVTEDASNPTLTDTGTLTIDDADAGESVFQAGNGVPSQGALGSLTIDTNGNWTYNVANADVQYLGEGETKVETFVVLSADGTEHTITITITGTNDVPVIAGDDSGAVTEDASNPTLTDTGTLTIDDADAGESVFQAGNGVPSQGALGSLTIDTNGNWTYNVANADVQYLGEGETKVETFVVLSADGTEHTITITITGTNDSPVITNDSSALSGTVVEAGNLDDGTAVAGTPSVSGQLSATDVDSGDHQTWSVLDSSNDFGTFSVDANGQWTFTLNNNAAATQALAEGQSEELTFTVRVTDNFGAYVDQVVTVTITGTNDSPIITNDSSALSGTVVEAGNLDDGTAVAGTPSVSGQLSATDVDSGDHQTWSVLDSSNDFGTFSVDANGQWTFTLNNNAAATQALAEGQSEELTFTVRVTDDFGAYVDQVVTITITGTNDIPTLVADTGSVTEDTNVTVDGNLTTSGTLEAGTGGDAGEDKFTADTFNGQYGTLTLDADGNWVYTADNSQSAIQNLNSGESLTEEFKVYNADGVTWTTVTITIHGTDEISGGSNVDLIVDDANTQGTATDSDSAGLSFTAGAYDVTGFAFGNIGDINVSGLDANISWSLDSSGNLIGKIDGNAVLQLSLSGSNISAGATGTVTVSVTLLDNLPHGTSVDELVINGITVVATDAANDTATGTVSVKVIDDGVTVNPLDLAGDNAAGIYDGVINVDGADQGFSADLSGNISGAGTFSDSGITAGGLTVFYYVDPANPSMLIAYSDTSGTPSAYDSGNSAQSVIFTLSIDPNGGTYQLDLKHAIDELSTVTVANMSGGKGGNTPAVYVTFDGTNYIIDNDINDVDPNNAMVFSLTSTVGNISSTVNGNTNGFGVANAFVDQGENLIIDYANDVASASVSFDGATYIHFKAYDADGNLLGEGDITNGQTIGNLGEISYIEISTSSLDNHSNFQFTGTSAENIVSSTVDVDLDFVVDVTDSDGDTSTGSIHVDLDAPGSTTTAPTALTSNAVSMLSEADLYKDGTESDSQSLRFKSGSESITAFQFGDTDNIHVSGVNAKISWSFNDEGQLIGTFMGKEAIRLTLNGDRIESGEEGSVSVTAELLASFPHNVSTENLVISGINIVGVDALGQKAVSTITVSVSDYAEAVNDSVRGTEDHDLSGNLLTNDIDPDDELSIVSFKLSGNTYQADGSTINLAEGKLSIHADGRFTFEPNLHWSGTLPQIEYLTNTGDTAILDLNVVAVADAPILSASTGDVVQGEVALDINVALVDRDGSESLTDVTIQGVPSGVSLSAGTLNADGSWTVAVNQLGNLSIKADDSYNGDLEFTLAIKASSVEQSNSDSASSQTTLDVSLRNYHYDNGTDGDNVINGGEDNDVIVSDTTGIQVVQGENYNVAFILDSSGSMGSNRIESAKDQLLQVFNTLKASVGGATSGTVNVLLVDFNSGTKAHVAVNLADSDAISKLESVLKEISSDNGRTNYEAAFETVIDWFSHGSAASNTGTNLTYFITDGETNNYNVDAAPEDVWVYNTYGNDWDRTLGDLLDQYVPGEELKHNGKVIVDEYGNINYWYRDDGSWKHYQTGSIRVDENGDYYVAKIASGYSNGNGTDVTAESEALAAFQVLNTLSNVEAIGIGSGISLNKLTPYDSDGNVATNINVSDLASIILGSKEMLLQGDDTVNAGEGNDIVFGDLVQFDGIDGQGYAALQKYVALQLGEDASTVTIQDVHEFVAANPALFDTSRDHDGDDILAGNQGNDILFGQGGDDELHGGSGDDMLLGGHGSDMLIGGAGEDILIGGLGDDTLTGGTGKADGEADTFVWQQGDTGTDHITDFDINQDKLDLSDLLQGENGGNLEDYLHFTVDNGSTTIEIDANNDGHVDQTIVLDGVDLSHLGTTDGQIINGLLGSEGNGALIVDNANVNQAASSFAVPTTQDDDGQIQHLVP
ncbi:VCBS domain-containing protein [Shewanella spartinae]|nr:VCBS domain-containing protein [Shewanella spartinae]